MCVGLLDIKKAYPSASWNATWRVLKNEGVPEKVIGIVRGLQTTTEYTTRTPLGDSEVYKLLRGLREGCPSSPVVFNFVHNAVLRYHLRKEEERGSGGGLHFRGGGDRRPRLQGNQGPKFRKAAEEAIRVCLKLVGFADDTTLLERQSHYEQRRADLTEDLAAWGETVHPGKWHHLRVAPRVPTRAQPQEQQEEAEVKEREQQAQQQEQEEEEKEREQQAQQQEQKDGPGAETEPEWRPQ